MQDLTDLNKQFLDFGALGYAVEKIASILSVDVAEATAMLKGEYAKSYQTGKDRFDFTVDQKLMQLAAQGDMKALDRLQRAYKAQK